MKTPATTAATQSIDVQQPGAVGSRSTSPGKSKYSFRLLFFTFISVLACMLALANIASASTPSGEDQYLEQTPNGGGQGGKQGTQGYVNTVGGQNGTVTEADVKTQAEKNKQKKKKGKDEGSTGSTGSSGAAGAGTQPPSTGTPVQSVATSAKLGPFSRTTGIALILLVAALLGGAVVMRNRANTGGGTTAS